MKLTQTDIDDFQNLNKLVSQKETIITARIHEVLKEVISKCFKNELDWWNYYGDTGGRYPDGGSLGENWAETISLYVNLKSPSVAASDHWDLISEFPQRYLIMDNEDIVKEITSIIEQDIKEEQEMKEKQKLAKIAKEKKKKDAIATLTLEQKEALGLK